MKIDIPESRIIELIRLCQQQAAIAVTQGNTPFGCVMTDMSGNIMVSAPNTANADHDASAHAEINAMRRLGQLRQSRYFEDCVLFANAESCAMCFCAAIKSRIRHFYHGAAAEPDMNPALSMREIATRAKPEVFINGPYLAEECAAQIAAARKS